jgi:hypothetical protein
MILSDVFTGASNNFQMVSQRLILGVRDLKNALHFSQLSE